MVSKRAQIFSSEVKQNLGKPKPKFYEVNNHLKLEDLVTFYVPGIGFRNLRF